MPRVTSRASTSRVIGGVAAAAAAAPISKATRLIWNSFFSPGGARRGARTATSVRRDAGLFPDHLFEALEIGHERSLVHHADLADDGRALGEYARVVRADHVRAHPHELRESLRDQGEVPALDASAEGMQDHDARAAARRRDRLAAGALEGHERHR